MLAVQILIDGFAISALYGLTALMCFVMIWALFLPREKMLGIVHLWLRQVTWIERHL